MAGLKEASLSHTRPSTSLLAMILRRGCPAQGGHDERENRLYSASTPRRTASLRNQPRHRPSTVIRFSSALARHHCSRHPSRRLPWDAGPEITSGRLADHADTTRAIGNPRAAGRRCAGQQRRVSRRHGQPARRRYRYRHLSHVFGVVLRTDHDGARADPGTEAAKGSVVNVT